GAYYQPRENRSRRLKVTAYERGLPGRWGWDGACSRPSKGPTSHLKTSPKQLEGVMLLLLPRDLPFWGGFLRTWGHALRNGVIAVLRPRNALETPPMTPAS